MDTSWVIRKFYAAANAVNCHTKSVQELSRLYLLEAFTLPILTYGCDGIFVSCSNIRKMNVYNVYRKVFNMNIWELVECIQLFCGRLDFVHVAVLRKLKFYISLYRANNSVVKECFCSIWFDIRFQKLCLDYVVMIDSDCLRYDIYSKFRSLCRL